MAITLENLHLFKEDQSPYWCVLFDTPAGNHRAKEIAWWCYENFGPGLGDFRVDNSPFIHRWINDLNYGAVRFSQEADANWFLLRWS